MLTQEYFTGAGGHRLSSFHLAGSMPGMLLVGGYGEISPLNKAFGQVALAYCQSKGLDLRILEFRGQGGSEGHRFQTTVPDMRDDLLALARCFSLEGRIGVGSSLGAWAMLAAQQKNPSLLWGMVALAPAVDWDRTYFPARLADGRATREIEGAIVVLEDNVAVLDSFLDRADEARLNAPGGLSLRGPIRILHGAGDGIAPLSRSVELVTELAAAGNDTALRILPGFGHDLSLLTEMVPQRGFIEECELLLLAYQRFSKG